MVNNLYLLSKDRQFNNETAFYSPMLESKEILDLDLGIVDPRKAAEMVLVTFLHSIPKIPYSLVIHC